MDVESGFAESHQGWMSGVTWGGVGRWLPGCRERRTHDYRRPSTISPDGHHHEEWDAEQKITERVAIRPRLTIAVSVIVVPRQPRVTGIEVLRALQRAGWRETRRRGSHVILHHESRPGRVVVPIHVGTVLKPKTLASILDQVGITPRSALMGAGMRTYSIVLDPDPEGGFTVTVPALPGCITQGETIEECLAHAREAIELYLEDLIASGEPIPEEKEHPRLLQVTVAA